MKITTTLARFEFLHKYGAITSANAICAGLANPYADMSATTTISVTDVACIARIPQLRELVGAEKFDASVQIVSE